MMNYYGMNYALADAIDAFIVANDNNLPPIIKSGRFRDRDITHVYIYVPVCTEFDRHGSCIATVNLGVQTLMDTPIEDHIAYCNRLFNLIRDENAPALISDKSEIIGSNQAIPGATMREGELPDAARFTELEIAFRLYGKPAP